MEIYDDKEEKDNERIDSQKEDLSIEEEKIQKEEKILPEEENDDKKENIEESPIDKTISKKHNKMVKILIIAGLATLVLAILSTGFALLNINNKSNILGVKIKDINIQGLTKEESIQLVSEKLNQELEKEINFKYEDFEYSITPKQIEAGYNIEQSVEQAYSIGRGKNIFVNNYEILYTMLFGKVVTPELTYNKELLDTAISNISTKLPNALVNTSYYIEEDKLIITKGTAGNGLDAEVVRKLILNQIESKGEGQINLPVITLEPDSIDIEKIYGEVYTEPKDAYYTKSPFQIYPQVNGINFDVEAAKEILKEDKNEYEIPLNITIPKVTTSSIGTEAFPDLISSFTTKYDASNTQRTKNLKLAADKINGTVLMPEETFSYNKVVGERTIEKGYKEAAGYVSGKVAQTLGGGICQISSTLYDAAVYANLKIIERRNHMFLTSYTTAGRDATVVYGSIDFKFKNTRAYPIMIKASVQNGIAKMEIYGIKEDIEYEVEIATTILNYIPFKVIYEEDSSLAPDKESVSQKGMNGSKSITYKILKLNGVEVSREVLSTDTYDAMNKIIKRGPSASVPTQTETIPVVTEPVEEEPTEPVNTTIVDNTTNTTTTTDSNTITNTTTNTI